MKIRLLWLLFAAMLLSGTVSSQSCPPNIDFEKGDFSSWECFIGSTAADGDRNVITLNPSAALTRRHEIITASTAPRKDPFGNFPVFCPYGGHYSVKLGNDQTGGEAEGLSYTFTVPSTIDTFTFTYYYAVVFEDPAHAHNEQPRFFVTAYDVASGEVINCASYDYVANGSMPGFEKSARNPGVLYKNWSPTSLQFAGLSGRQVRLEFKTADCTLGGHFGYAYVDVGSGCSNILATAPYCIETNSLTLNAPYGFKTYTWYKEDFSAVVGDQQFITFNPPPVTSGMFYVDVVPYPGYGCRDTFQAVVTPLPIPDTPVTPNNIFCQYGYGLSLEATPSPGNDIIWYVGDTTGTGTEIAPLPPTSELGELYYFISQKALFGCESYRKKITVRVVPTPVASFTCNNLRQCENGNRFVFTSTSTNRSACVYEWDFGDGTIRSSAKDSVVTHSYKSGGTFPVRLKITNEGTCSSEQYEYVTVVPKPVADFTFPSIVCEKQTPFTFADQSSVPGGISNITQWWWNIDGAVSHTQNPGTFIPDLPGNIPVRLVVTTEEGCYSDTAKVTMPVHYRPVANFKYSTLLCNNEVIRLTDLSVMPQGAGVEHIVKWHWQFPHATSGAQHPSLNLLPGLQRARLVAETNFGCRSSETEIPFTVHAKPGIKLDINDSCVFRSIRYKALDMDKTVKKWFWDFGDGLYKGDSIITKTYHVEGNKPLILIGQTIYGCKDTIRRPFRIYDNKAFAGRDTITAIDEPVQLNARGGPGVTYAWSPAIGLNNPALENPVAVLDRDQRYRLDALTREGCDSHSDILIKRFKGPELYIPTAFTPNGDGTNDLLKVFPVGIRAFHYFAVYNRYGELVFKTTDYGTGWDGLYKGIKQGTETFVVVSQAIDYRGKLFLKKGTVTLIR
jgi:gliding motility-associated-like protein